MSAYAVTCLDDGKRVEATSRRFDTAIEAEAYLETVDASREPEVVMCCWCGEWRTVMGDRGWPECVNCGMI